MRYDKDSKRELGAHLPWAAMALVAVTAAILLLGSSPPVATQEGGGGGIGRVPRLEDHFNDDALSMAVRVAFADRDTARVESVEVLAGRPPARSPNPALLRVDLMNGSRAVETFNAWHPMWTHVRDDQGQESLTVIPNEATILFPFRPSADRMRVTDVPLGQEVLAVDLIPATLAYCEANAADARCHTDLRLDSIRTNSTVRAGSELTYYIPVINEGPAPAPSVRLTNTLPDGVTHTADNSGCVSAPKGTVTCELGLMRAYEHRVVTITVTVDPDLPNRAEITNVARLEGGITDPDSQDNRATVTTEVLSFADLEVSLSEAPNPVVAGTELTYTVDVANKGPATAHASVTDDLPPSVFHQSNTGGCTEEIALKLVCDLGPIPPGERRQFSITVFVSSDLTHQEGNPTTVSNKAEVANLSGFDDVDGNNRKQIDTVVIEVADVGIAKSDGGVLAGAGSRLRYTFEVTNEGPSTASKPRVVDSLPSEASYISDTGGCTHSSGTLTCDLEAIQVGQSRTFTVDVLTDANMVCGSGDRTKTIVNRATVTNPGGGAGDPDNNETVVTTLVSDVFVTGGAFGERSDAIVLGIPVLQTGPRPSVDVPPGCGPFQNSATAAPMELPGAFSTGALRVSVEADRSGPDAFVRSTADTAYAAISVRGFRLEGLHSECRSDVGGSSGSTSVSRVVVGSSTSMNLSPRPNTEIQVPGVGVLVLNEHIVSDDASETDKPGRTSITVNGAHLKLSGPDMKGEIILSQSRCAVEGPNVASSPPGGSDDDEDDGSTGLVGRVVGGVRDLLRGLLGLLPG